MNINTFVSKFKISDKSEIEKVEYLAYFHSQGKSNFNFSIDIAAQWLIDAGFSNPNKTRLKTNIQKSKNLVKSNIKDNYKLHIDRLHIIDKELSLFSKKNKEFDFSESILPVDLTKTIRTYLHTLAMQINASYDNCIYDGCAVLMRRLLEILIIHSYEHLKIEGMIKNHDGSYKMLSEIINDTKTNSTINLSRNSKQCIDTFRDVGNFAAHKIYYNTKISDIDNIKINYRATIEELLYKSGLRS